MYLAEGLRILNSIVISCLTNHIIFVEVKITFLFNSIFAGIDLQGLTVHFLELHYFTSDVIMFPFVTLITKRS
jgi:hypothetical protein